MPIELCDIGGQTNTIILQTDLIGHLVQMVFSGVQEAGK